MNSGRLRYFLLCPILFGCFSAGARTPSGGYATPRHVAPLHLSPWKSAVAYSQEVHIGGSTLQIDFAPGTLDLNHNEIVQWIKTAAHAVSTYYGAFPVPRARVLVVPIADRRGVLTGTTWGDVDGFPAFTRMRLGQHTTQQDLADDWTMTHEFIHTALPSLSRDHHWLEEGTATYVESIARAQLGTLSPEKIWGDMVRDMPKGEPGPSDQGLDQTHTWASTYWGGALFCLVADVTLREKTGNRKGLQDALRGIVSAGGTIAQEWPIAKVLAAGDQATGTSVLTDLYRKMGEAPYPPIDLNQLWQRLGIRFPDGGIVFDNNAPLAKIRLRITSPNPHAKGI